MPRKRKVVKVTRKGRIVEIPRWVYEYNQKRRLERLRAAKTNSPNPKKQN